jgi:hypothetical protein
MAESPAEPIQSKPKKVGVLGAKTEELVKKIIDQRMVWVTVQKNHSRRW